MIYVYEQSDLLLQSTLAFTISIYSNQTYSNVANLNGGPSFRSNQNDFLPIRFYFYDEVIVHKLFTKKATG